MPKISNHIGKRVGYLTVISRVHNDNKGGTQWNCHCECGNEVIVRGQYLSPSKRGYQQECCSQRCPLYLQKFRIDITGQRFGRLAALKCLDVSNINGEVLWQFKCDCGELVESSGTSVRRGYTRSCGCLFHDVHFKHGKDRSWIRNLRKPKWLTTEHKRQIKEFYLLAKRLTLETGILHEVDHIYPLCGDTCSGLHVPWNLRVITEHENRVKNKYLPKPEDIVLTA
jgi:hypothetical protein